MVLGRCPREEYERKSAGRVQLECNQIFHLSTAACTSLPISIRACFFALAVMPSSASRAPGDVCSGSNSSRCPSFVGMATMAENDRVCFEVCRGVVSLPDGGGGGGKRNAEFRPDCCAGRVAWDGSRVCDEVDCDVDVNKLACEACRECRVLDGSRRITILLFDRFRPRDVDGWSVSSSSSASSLACSTPLNQPRPN